MSKKDDCQPSIFFKFSKAFHCLGTLSCNTVVSSALTPATLRRSVCVFSPLTDALVCFSGCETKPLPYYSTSLQIGTSLRPVPLISFFFTRAVLWFQSVGLAPLHGAARRSTTTRSRACYHFHYQVRRAWTAAPCQEHVLAADSICSHTLRECRRTTRPSRGCPNPTTSCLGSATERKSVSELRCWGVCKFVHHFFFPELHCPPV